MSLSILRVDMSSTYRCYEFEIFSQSFVIYFSTVDDNVLSSVEHALGRKHIFRSLKEPWYIVSQLEIPFET